MIDTLVAKTCTPCRGGIPPLTTQEAEHFHVHVPQWEVRDEARRIERTFRSRNFREAFALVQQVAELAEAEGHHPDISFGWGYVTVVMQTKKIKGLRLERLERAPDTEPHGMVRLLARVTGVGIETADLLVHEVFLRPMRDRRAVARYGGLTGSPDRSGATSRERGMARSGNARVRRGMIQLAWRFLLFQKDSALAQWYRRRTEHAPKARKTMIVALARKLLIALWQLVREGVVPEGVTMRPA